MPPVAISPRRPGSPGVYAMSMQRPRFDYSALPSELAASLRTQVEQIRSRIATTVQNIIDTGRDLLAVKARLSHGQFTNWVQIELGIHIRTAERIMNAARFVEGKNDIVSLLPLSALNRLPSNRVPAALKADAISKIERGEPPDAVITEMARAARQQRRQGREAKIKSGPPHEKQEEETDQARKAALELFQKFGLENTRILIDQVTRIGWPKISTELSALLSGSATPNQCKAKLVKNQAQEGNSVSFDRNGREA